MENTRDRVKGAPWFKEAKDSKVFIGGSGGIGSYLAFFLSRLGCRITIADDDIIESHNLGGQFFTEKQAKDGIRKVEATRLNVKEFSGELIGGIGERITEENVEFAVSESQVFSAFDNMKARKILFDNWVKNNKEEKGAIFIDGRLNAEQFQVFCVTPDKVDRYLEDLFEDSEIIDQGQCSFKQTSHVAGMIASFMTGFFTNHLVNIKEGEEIRDVPYKTEYLLPANLFIYES